MKWWDNYKKNRALARESKENKKKMKRERVIREGKLKRRGTIALCLGGGGARGFAHIGALQAFHEAHIDFDLVAGTSVGALVGAFYAAGVTPKDMMAFGSALEMKDIRKGAIWRPDDSNKIGNVFRKCVGDVEFTDLKKPLYIVATDLVEGRQIILDSGNVGTAVAASATVPLFFKPLVVGDRHYVDGGLLNNIPADVCRMMGADYVITIDVNPTRGGGTEELGIVSVLKATFSIMGANASTTGLINSDIIIAPDLSKFKATDKEGYEEMYQLGYDAAKEKCAEILALIYGD